jgi:tetratricopeptide (TPR) repeat protein
MDAGYSTAWGAAGISMAINKGIAISLILLSSAAAAHEAATPAACQAAALQPPIATAKDAVARNPAVLRAQFNLADAWSEAGCFNEALQVLSAAAEANPGNKELETRLRVARSVVGEENFFETLNRADDQARLKRATFRCTSLADPDACGEAVHLQPDDASLLVAQGDALMHAGRAADAMNAYRHAAELAPEHADLTAKMAAAQAQIPALTVASSNPSPPLRVSNAPTTRPPAGYLARVTPQSPPRYSNLEPESQSH